MYTDINPGIMMIMAILGLIIFFVIRYWTKEIVPEDYNAVVVDQDGFFRRVLPTGIHHLRLGVEKVDFMFETKPKRASNSVIDVLTSDGILLTIDWWSTYVCNTTLIEDRSKISQRVRNFPKAEEIIQGQVDLILRQLIGHYNILTLFKPDTREIIEQQLTETLRRAVMFLGLEISRFHLRVMTLPDEVLQSFNQARAIASLDEVIKASDISTLKIVTAVHNNKIVMELKDINHDQP